MWSLQFTPLPHQSSSGSTWVYNRHNGGPILCVSVNYYAMIIIIAWATKINGWTGGASIKIISHPPFWTSNLHGAQWRK